MSDRQQNESVHEDNPLFQLILKNPDTPIAVLADVLVNGSKPSEKEKGIQRIAG